MPAIEVMPTGFNPLTAWPHTLYWQNGDATMQTIIHDWQRGVMLWLFLSRKGKAVMNKGDIEYEYIS
ncbi:hypothetical protein HYS48_02190 [Candidatus Woesearchaeota archaeon]|nr:hypothetical protein [Candidatus Woesearchaeota archaeon]